MKLTQRTNVTKFSRVISRVNVELKTNVSETTVTDSDDRDRASLQNIDF
jgi:hypothetical protein